MKQKSPKVYTLAQVGKLLGVGQSTVYNYIIAGLISVLPRVPGKKEGRRVSEDEFQRLKRDGVNPVGIKAFLAERGSVRASARKRAGRGASSVAAAKKQALRGAPAAAKKRAKRAAEPVRTAAKKQAKRPAARKAAKKKTR